MYVLDPDISNHAESDLDVSHPNFLNCFTPGLFGPDVSHPYLHILEPDISDPDDVLPPDILDQGLSPPDALDLDVSPQTFWTRTFLWSRTFRPITFWVWTFRLLIFWTRTFPPPLIWTWTFRPLIFWTSTFRPGLLGPGRFAPRTFRPKTFWTWTFRYRTFRYRTFRPLHF